MLSYVEPHLRDVDEDVRVAKIARQPAPPLHVQLDLPDARVDGHVQLGHHGRPDDTVIGQPVPALETFDRVLQAGIVNGCGVRRGGFARQVVCGRQPERESVNCR